MLSVQPKDISVFNLTGKLVIHQSDIFISESHKMDVSILASYIGFWSWRVKRHFSVKVFNNLSEKVLQKYTDIFEISIEQLKDIEYEN